MEASITKQKTFAIAALLIAATGWGLIWYPYRLFHQLGVSVLLASALTYCFAFLFSLIGAVKKQESVSGILVSIALAAGWCNLSFFVATSQGNVVRVLLLFYLAPLWTIVLARFLLKEQLNYFGYLIMFLSLSGACVMLWDEKLGVPLPRDITEWLAVSSGIAFALSNVLSRKAQQHSIEMKSLSVFAGGAVLGLIGSLVIGDLSKDVLQQYPPFLWTQLLIFALVMVIINFCVQYGVAHTPANQAIVILLFELVVTAVAAWLLINQTLSHKEMIGGAMIIAASLFSGKLQKTNST